jgi:hypothetical protein
MIRFLLRLCGLIIFAAGFVALVIDGSRSIAGSGVFLTPLNTVLDALSPQMLAAMKQSLQAGSAAILWDGGLAWIVRQPTCLILGLVGFLLMLLGRKRRPPLGLKPV